MWVPPPDARGDWDEADLAALEWDNRLPSDPPGMDAVARDPDALPEHPDSQHDTQ